MDYNADLYYVGEQIRKARESEGLSQEELADRMGMSVSTLYRFESGRRVLPIDIFFRFSEELNVPASQMIPPRLDKGAGYPVDSQKEQLNAKNKKVVEDTMQALINSLLATQ